MKANRRFPRLAHHFLASIILFAFQNLYGQAPTITGFTPASGPVGTDVTITGTNFNTTPTNNVVIFGATTVVATSATANQLTVKIPTGATYSPITVLNTATKLSAFSPRYFVPTFTPNTGTIAASDFTTKVSITTGDYPFYNTVCDFDGDGKTDIAVVNSLSKTISVLRNTSTVGNITYAAKEDIGNTASNPGGGPGVLATGDLDGDGKQDLAVLNGGEEVSVLRNTSSSGSITFASKVDFVTAAGEGGASITIADFDGDGKPDVAVGTAGATISVLRNTTTGGVLNFSKTDFLVGASHDGIAVGDFDGDDKPDVVVTNYLSATVSVLRNTSVLNTISFAAGVTFSAVPYARDIAIGDLDGDGKLDIAVPSNDSYGIDLLRNTSTVGTIAFAPEVNIVTGGNIFSVRTGDLDGDGKPDLAAEATGAGKLYVYENNSTTGNLAFGARVEIPLGVVAQGMAIADVDNDGKSDLVVSIPGGDRTVVVRNNPVTATDPVITSFTPTSGSVGATVTINGSNFSTTPANNAVKFNGTAATVTASTSTTITTTVPTGATTGKITVTVGSSTATSAGNFSVTCTTPAKPTITAEGSDDFTSTTLTSSVAPVGGTYQWLRNGTIIAGATSQQYTTSDVGSFTVRITVAGGCNATSDPFEIVITGTEQPTAASSIYLYPNPATEWLTLSMHKWPGEKNVTVYHATGKRLATLDSVGEEIKIYVADYPAGMCFVKVSTPDGFGVLKFIKQ